MRINDRITFGRVEPICGLGLVRRLKDAASNLQIRPLPSSKGCFQFRAGDRAPTECSTTNSTINPEVGLEL